MIITAPLNLHPDQVLIDHRRYKPHKLGDGSILLSGSGLLLIKNRCKHRRRTMRIYLSVYDYEDIYQFDNFLLSVPEHSTTMLPFEHPEGRPLSIHIYCSGFKHGLRICILSRTPWIE